MPDATSFTVIKRAVNSVPAEQIWLAGQLGENTRQSRDIGVPHMVVTGNNSDEDMRQYRTLVLKNQVPITMGFNGAQCSGISINLNGGRVFDHGIAALIENSGPSTWHQTYISGGKTKVAIAPSVCGQPH